MAQICLAAKISPSEYKALTLYEYRAFINALTQKPNDDLWLP
jgi:hypothetical protein